MAAGPKRVASRVPAQGSGGDGGRTRRGPIGAAAYGMPRHWITGPIWVPTTFPELVSTSVAVTSRVSTLDEGSARQRKGSSRAPLRGCQDARRRRSRRYRWRQSRRGRRPPGGCAPVPLALMCGIIAILKRPSGRETPPAGPIISTLDEVVAELHAVAMDLGSRHGSPPALDHAASLLDGADVALRGTPGVACLLAEPGLAVADAVAHRLATLEAEIRVIEDRLDAEVLWSPSELESVNAALVRLKDGAWAIGRDRVAAARAIAHLWGCEGREDTIPAPALDALWAIQTALSSLDRLEVRGRDSAGLHVLVTGHGLDLSGPSVRALLGSRV